MRESTPGSSPPETSSSILVVASVVVVVVVVVVEAVVLSLVAVVLAGQIGLPTLTHVCVVVICGFGRFVVEEDFSLMLCRYLFIFFLLFLSTNPPPPLLAFLRMGFLVGFAVAVFPVGLTVSVGEAAVVVGRGGDFFFELPVFFFEKGATGLGLPVGLSVSTCALRSRSSLRAMELQRKRM